MVSRMSRVSSRRILQCATDLYVELETMVPHRDTRAAIFQMPHIIFLSREEVIRHFEVIRSFEKVTRIKR